MDFSQSSDMVILGMKVTDIHVFIHGIDPLLSALQKIGAFLSGVGIFAGAIAAYYIIRKADIQRQREDNFRKLYAEFWKDDDVCYVRRCITNNNEYADLEKILFKRNSCTENNLSKEENDVLERVDKFCAALVHVKSLSRGKMNKTQKKMWNKLLYADFWATRAYSRHELRKYINKHWPEIRLSLWKVLKTRISSL